MRRSWRRLSKKTPALGITQQMHNNYALMIVWQGKCLFFCHTNEDNLINVHRQSFVGGQTISGILWML